MNRDVEKRPRWLFDDNNKFVASSRSLEYWRDVVAKLVRRDLYIWKETCKYEKRPMYVKRDLEKRSTCTSEGNDCLVPSWIREHRRDVVAQLVEIDISIKRDLYIWKETYIHEKRRTYIWIETYIYMKRDLSMWKETYIYEKGPMYMKETYIYEKRPTYLKRDLHVWKETYI